MLKMKENEINKYNEIWRQDLTQELEKARNGGEVKPIKLNIDREILEKIIFEYHKTAKGEKYKVFAIDNDFLKLIDFSGISFNDFKVDNDLVGYTGIEIDPQTIFEKSLFGVKLEGVTFKSENDDPFEGVNLFYTSIIDCPGAVIDPQTIHLRGLYETTLKNVEIKSRYEDAFNYTDLKFANIIDCPGAVIDPQTIYDKSLRGTTLEGVIIKSKKSDAFENVDLKEANLINCPGAVINPQTIYNKSLSKASLKGIAIKSDNGYPFEGVETKGFTYDNYSSLGFLNQKLVNLVEDEFKVRKLK